MGKIIGRETALSHEGNFEKIRLIYHVTKKKILLTYQITYNKYK